MYFDHTLSFRKDKIRILASVLLFASLTAIGSFIRLPLKPVPFTMQVFFVLLSGLVLGPTLGALSQLTYIMMGLVGAQIGRAHV